MSTKSVGASSPTPQCSHRGGVVRVGKFSIMAGGTQYLEPDDLARAEVLVPLTLERVVPWDFGVSYSVLAAPLQDYGGVPPYWQDFLEESVIPRLEAGKKLLVFCIGSHGRTGCFLGSLIALLESKIETPDPIAAVRARHCLKAVESRRQAEAIFALRGEELPLHYHNKFHH